MRRFIPACAGNSSANAKPACWTPVHPRVCGELVRGVVEFRERVGSSPRVRGTPAGDPIEQSDRRFIPACAGNSPWNAP